MKIIRSFKNYFFYCGIERDEYNAVKKDAYVSNFEVWKILHFLMAAVFGVLFLSSLSSSLLEVNDTLDFYDVKLDEDSDTTKEETDSKDGS